MIAALLSPSVRAGRTIASTLPWPTAGRSRRCRANTSSSMMPNQKLGIETANSDAAMVPLSRADPGRTAARVPSATPIGMASPSPTSASRTVYGKDSPISVATCRLPLNERPRSPCTAFHRKRPNWTGKRPIQPELAPDALVRLLGRAHHLRARSPRLRHHQQDGVAGKEVEHREDHRATRPAAPAPPPGAAGRRRGSRGRPARDSPRRRRRPPAPGAGRPRSPTTVRQALSHVLWKKNRPRLS